MRSLLATLFSVVLIASQAASVNGPGDLGSQRASTPKCCEHCGPCKGRCCCGSNDNSGPRHPTPAVPSRGSSQNDLQTLVSMSLHLLSQSTAETTIVRASIFVPPSVAVPLYQRNCSYLI